MKKSIIIAVVSGFLVVIAGIGWFIASRSPKALTNVRSTNSESSITSDQQIFNKYDPTFTDSDIGLMACYLRSNSRGASDYPAGTSQAWFFDQEKNPDYYPENAAYNSLCSNPSLATEERLVWGKILFETDTDGDGLSLYFEKVSGTSDQNADSDDDGFGDWVEVESGHSPTGS